MTWRRLRVIIEHLPPESATMTALRNSLTEEQLAEQAEAGEPEKGRWSQLEQLVAGMYDRLGRIEYVLICAHTEKKRDRPEQPEPLRRPGARPKRRREPLTDSGAEVLFQLINGAAAP